MTETPDARGETIDDLLHDAERADGGVMMAQMMGDSASAARLTNKARRLFAAAVERDPERKDGAWQECDQSWLTRMTAALSRAASCPPSETEND